MKYILIRRDRRPGGAACKAAASPRGLSGAFPETHGIRWRLIREGTDTSGNLDIGHVTGNVIVFAADRETVEEFHRNDPYTQEDMFEFAIIEPIWQRVPAVDPD